MKPGGSRLIGARRTVTFNLEEEERPVSYSISRRGTKTDCVGFKAGDTVGGAHAVGNKMSGMGFQSAC
jgi:hypothetical protein